MSVALMFIVAVILLYVIFTGRATRVYNALVN